MPGTIVQGPISPSQIGAPGLYVQILPPPQIAQGSQANFGAVVGSASWGPVNQPVLTGNSTDVLRGFGQVGSASAYGAGINSTLPAPANPYELVSEALAAYSQTQGRAPFGLWCVRAVDGSNYAQGGSAGTGGSGQNTTAAYASLVLNDTAGSPVAGLTAYGLYFGTLGNGVSISIAASTQKPTQATLFSASTTSGDGITWTAVPVGAQGNNITITINAPSGGTSTASITGNAITISPKTGETNAGLITAISSTVASLVTGVATGGTDLVVARTIASLTGGTSSATVTVTPPGGLGLSVEVYPNIPEGPGTFNGHSYGSLFWPTLANYLMNGIPSVRGPSLLLFAYQDGSSGTGKPSTSAVNPSRISTTLLTGGVDGCTNVTGGFGGTNTLPANMIGSGTAFPATGMYTLANLLPPVSHFRLAGFGENATDTSGSGPTLSAFATAIGAATYFGFPIGDDSSTSTATAAVTSNGVDNWEVIYAKDHQLWNDGISGARFFPPSPFAMGTILTLPPQNSPLNQAILGTQGSYRDTSAGAPAPYSNAEITACQTGRIALIAKPSPGGVYEGFNTGVNASSNPVQSPIEYTTLTNYIARTLALTMGKFVGLNQSSSNPQDPVRGGCQNDLDQLLQTWIRNGTIDSGFAQCDLNNNSAATIAAHFLFASVLAKYLASVWFFLLSFTGGTTVQIQVTQGPLA